LKDCRRVSRLSLDDPSKRPAPVEKRDNSTLSKIRAWWAVDKAPELWKTVGPAGIFRNTCHSDPAAFRPGRRRCRSGERRLGKVLVSEEFVTRHARATTGAIGRWKPKTPRHVGLSALPRQWRADYDHATSGRDQGGGSRAARR